MSYPREVIEAVKAEVLKETKDMRLANRYVSVSGERMTHSPDSLRKSVS